MTVAVRKLRGAALVATIALLAARTRSPSFLIALAASACGLASACSGVPAAPPPVNGTVTVEVLPNPLNPTVGGSGNLTATARNSAGNSVSSAFSWSSQSPAVATVTWTETIVR